MSATVVRFDRVLTQLHVRDEAADPPATMCGEPMPAEVAWIDWPDDGTPHCGPCFGAAVEQEALL